MQHIKRPNPSARGLSLDRGVTTAIAGPLLTLFCCGCAADPVGAEGEDAATSATSDPTTAGDSDGSQPTASVIDLGPWSFCSSAPPHRDLDDQSWLFRSKYRVALTPGMFSVPAGGGLPYVLEVHGEPATTAVVDDDRNSFVVVPGKWSFGDGGGNSGEIDADPTHQSLVFAEVFQIEPPVIEPWLGEPVSEAWLRVITSMPVAGDAAEFIIDENAVVDVFGLAPMYACGASRPPPAVTHVEFDGGAVEFETIPGAITTRAMGVLDGVAIDVSDYFDLDYSGWRPGGGYLADAMFGVRLPGEGPSGECALYVFLPNDADNTLSDAEAWWLDCDGERLREVDVTAFNSVLPDA